MRSSARRRPMATVRTREKRRPRRGLPPALKEGQQAPTTPSTRPSKSTTSRRELARHHSFDQVSPEVGELDEAAFDDADARGPRRGDGAARRHDPRPPTPAARAGPAPRRPAVPRRRPPRPRPRRAASAASTTQPYRARRRRPRRRRQHSRRSSRPAAAGAAVDPERLRVRALGAAAHRAVPARRPQRLDGRQAAGDQRRRRGGGRVPRARRLQRGRRSPRTSVVVKSQDGATPVEAIVDGVLSLRGHGTTDLAGALDVAGQQLARSNAGRKIVVLLSDCRATEPGDVVVAAAALDELAIVAPDGDDEEARAAGRSGRRHADDGQRPERRRRRPLPRAVLSDRDPQASRTSAADRRTGQQSTSRGGTMPMLFSAGPVARRPPTWPAAASRRRRWSALVGAGRRRCRRWRPWSARTTAPARRRATSRRGTSPARPACSRRRCAARAPTLPLIVRPTASIW